MENINFENLSAVAAVCALLVFVTKWLLGSFVERLKAIEVAVTQVNDAVNHTHERGDDALKLYDIALENHQSVREIQNDIKVLTEWKSGYDGGPLDTGEKVKDWCESCDKKFTTIDEKLDHVVSELNRVGCPKLTGRGEPLCDDNPDQKS